MKKTRQRVVDAHGCEQLRLDLEKILDNLREWEKNGDEGALEDILSSWGWVGQKGRTLTIRVYEIYLEQEVQEEAEGQS